MSESRDRAKALKTVWHRFLAVTATWGACTYVCMCVCMHACVPHYVLFMFSCCTLRSKDLMMFLPHGAKTNVWLVIALAIPSNLLACLGVMLRHNWRHLSAGPISGTARHNESFLPPQKVNCCWTLSTVFTCLMKHVLNYVRLSDI